MQYRKLIEVLQALDSGQMERLSDFIRSPYFNKNQPAIAVFDYLKTLHPYFPNNAVTTSTIREKVPGINGDIDLAKKMTLLLELTAKFLSLETNRDPVLERIGMLKAYKKLRLHRHFESLMRQLRKEMKAVPFRDFDHLWRMHKLQEEYFEGYDQKLLRTPDNTVDEVFNTLKQFYFTKKLRYAAEAVNRERWLGLATGSQIKNEILAFLNETREDEDLYLMLYGSIFRMNVEVSPENALLYFQKIKVAIRAFQDLIPKEELSSVCMYLENYCLIQINKGNKVYLHELLEIVQLLINKGMLLDNGRLNPHQFKIIVGVAIMLDKIDWTENFIAAFKKFLPQDLRNDYYNLAMGQVYYYKREYSKACRQLALASHNKKDVYFGFAVKKLLLKIGYETDNWELLDSNAEAYKKHLARHRSKIGENAVVLEKFFRYFRMLVNAGEDASKKEILLSRLLAEENFADKDWLVLMASSGKLRKRSSALPAAAHQGT